jgi:hypothetical protein
LSRDKLGHRSVTIELQKQNEKSKEPQASQQIQTRVTNSYSWFSPFACGRRGHQNVLDLPVASVQNADKYMLALPSVPKTNTTYAAVLL